MDNSKDHQIFICYNDSLSSGAVEFQHERVLDKVNEICQVEREKKGLKSTERPTETLLLDDSIAVIENALSIMGLLPVKLLIYEGNEEYGQTYGHVNFKADSMKLVQIPIKSKKLKDDKWNIGSHPLMIIRGSGVKNG